MNGAKAVLLVAIMSTPIINKIKKIGINQYFFLESINLIYSFKNSIIIKVKIDP